MPPNSALFGKPVDHAHRFHVIHREYLDTNFFNYWREYLLLDKLVDLNIIEIPNMRINGICESQFCESKYMHKYLLSRSIKRPPLKKLCELLFHSESGQFLR